MDHQYLNILFAAGVDIGCRHGSFTDFIDLYEHVKDSFEVKLQL